ncbi:MAG: copper chaperone PCu(A)C [Corynebacterium nuruki]|nr:copper chaperone PCu(A)C [Corynebacterium nuruki]
MNISRSTGRRLTVAAFAATLSLGVAGLTACGDDSDGDQATTTAAGASAGTSAATSDAAADAVTLKDGYVGAKAADKAMTAVFGDLTNTTDKDIHLTKVTGDLPGMYQYHEVVNGVMKEMEDGLVVPAGGSVHMAPGGHHIMVMDNHDDIAAGDVLTLTLTAEDGTTYTLKDIPVRVQQSGHEDYGTDGMADGSDSGDGSGHDGGDGHGGMSGMDMDHAGH